LNGFREGKPEHVSHTRSLLLDIFEIVRNNLSVFTDEQRTGLIQWMNDVQKPRRERKTVNRLGGIPYQEQFINPFIAPARFGFDSYNKKKPSKKEVFRSKFNLLKMVECQTNKDLDYMKYLWVMDLDDGKML